MSEVPTQGMITCPTCGRLSSAASQFCPTCGQMLPAAQVPSGTPPAVPQPEPAPQAPAPPMPAPGYSRSLGFGWSPTYPPTQGFGGPQGYGPAPSYPGYGYAPIPAPRSRVPIILGMGAIGLILILIAGGVAFAALSGAHGTPVPSGIASGQASGSPSSSSVTPSPSAAPTPRPSSGMSTTGSLATGRWGNSTTVLDDGRVLVVGGFSGADAGVVSMAELYDPKTGKFTRTAALNRPRALHTATVLSDGRVLIAGGMSDTIAPVQAEVYDPKTGQFTTTGSLTAIRWGHTAVRLADGRVLVMGGETTVNGNSYSVLDTAELYDPETGTFSPTGSMASFRVWYTATLLTDGRVLVVGGSYGTSTNTYPKVAELYDPTTGKFSVTGSLAIGRSGHTATRLADGRVLIAGGKDDSSIFASAELYDPTTGKFTTTGSMSSARDYPTSTLLPDGRVLIAGGRNWSGGAWENYASTEIYNPATGKFTSGSPLAVARSRHTAVTLQDGSILLVGGRVEGPSIKACELYQP